MEVKLEVADLIECAQTNGEPTIQLVHRNCLHTPTPSSPPQELDFNQGERSNSQIRTGGYHRSFGGRQEAGEEQAVMGWQSGLVRRQGGRLTCDL